MSISRNNSTNYAAREKSVMPIIKRHCVNSQFLHFGRSSRGTMMSDVTWMMQEYSNIKAQLDLILTSRIEETYDFPTKDKK